MHVIGHAQLSIFWTSAGCWVGSVACNFWRPEDQETYSRCFISGHLEVKRHVQKANGTRDEREMQRGTRAELNKNAGGTMPKGGLGGRSAGAHAIWPWDVNPVDADFWKLRVIEYFQHHGERMLISHSLNNRRLYCLKQHQDHVRRLGWKVRDMITTLHRLTLLGGAGGTYLNQRPGVPFNLNALNRTGGNTPPYNRASGIYCSLCHREKKAKNVVQLNDPSQRIGLKVLPEMRNMHHAAHREIELVTIPSHGTISVRV